MHYDKGTIKLVWIPKINYTEMKSIMFDSVPEALSHVKNSGKSEEEVKAAYAARGMVLK